MNKAVDKEQISLLEKLMGLSFLKDYFLVGGTNLALKYNHRKSIDLDLFTNQDFSIETSNHINFKLKEVFGSSFESTAVSKVGVFGYIDGIKTDFVNYPYELLKQFIHFNGFRLAHEIDIAAMKINAIIGRGSKKDFYDIHLLLGKYSLKEILAAYQKKYKVDNINTALKSLVYFKDGEDKNILNNKVVSINNISWNKVKRDIENFVVNYKKIDLKN